MNPVRKEVLSEKAEFEKIIGFINRESPVGRLYQQHKGESAG